MALLGCLFVFPTHVVCPRHMSVCPRHINLCRGHAFEFLRRTYVCVPNMHICMPDIHICASHIHLGLSWDDGNAAVSSSLGSLVAHSIVARCV